MTPRKSDDPVIDEIRATRQRIWQGFDNDPAKAVAHYMRMQERYKDRMIGSQVQASAPVTRRRKRHTPAAAQK